MEALNHLSTKNIYSESGVNFLNPTPEMILSLSLGPEVKGTKTGYYADKLLDMPPSIRLMITVASEFVRRVAKPNSSLPVVVARTNGGSRTFKWNEESAENFPLSHEGKFLYELMQQAQEQIAQSGSFSADVIARLKSTNLYKCCPTEVRAFLEAGFLHPFDIRVISDASILSPDSNDCVWHDYLAFLLKLRKRCQDLELRKTLYDRNVREPKKRFVKLQGLLAELFLKHSRILVVRVDLKYKSEYAHDIEFAEFQSHIKEVSAAATKQKGNFEDCLAFVLRLEETPMAGLHCHAAFFYHGGRRHQDIKIAQGICLWWEQSVSSGKGLGWNVNLDWKQKSQTSPEKLAQLGIGLVDRRDEAQVVKMVETVSYLCLAGQDTLHKPARSTPVFISKRIGTRKTFKKRKEEPSSRS